MSVWGSIIREFKVVGGLTIERFGPVTWTNGRPSDPTPTTFCIDPVAVHPIMLRIEFMGRFVDDMSQGIDTNHKLVLYTLEPLQTPVEGDGVKGDRFNYQGQRFEIESSQPWLETQGTWSYYKSLATKVTA